MRTHLSKLLKTPLVLVALFTLALSGAAWAASKTLGTYLLNNTTRQVNPSSATDGYALTGTPVKAIVVTVADYNDGGTGDGLDELYHVDATAWCYKAATGGWSRMPQMDVALDAGTAEGRGISQAVVAPSIGTVDCSRIYYNTSNLNVGWDGGNIVHTVTLTEVN